MIHVLSVMFAPHFYFSSDTSGDAQSYTRREIATESEVRMVLRHSLRSLDQRFGDCPLQTIGGAANYLGQNSI